MLSQLTLTPATATILFIVAVLAGHRFRRNWKEEGPLWKYWVFGPVAGVCLLAVGLLPLEIG